ncbi:MAG: acyltransferase [Bryobacteraceae bacterium]|nr:acyltransferase [Bryobacteraceae bacterium]
MSASATPAPSATAPRAAAVRFAYRPSLDGLRAIAILLVMAHNARLPYTAGGFVGVDLFFTLSGYLITSILMAERDQTSAIRISRFYARRALRLLPALIVMIAVMCIYASVAQTAENARTTYLGAGYTIFYVANWVAAFQGEVLGVFGHAWSLSVEEQFYLIWPLLLLFLLRKRGEAGMLPFCLAAMAGSAIWRFALSSAGAPALRTYCGTDTRSDALLAGCALAFFLRNLPDPRRVALARYTGYAAVPAMAAWLTIAATAGADEPSTFQFWILVASLLGAVLIAAAELSNEWLTAILGFAPLVWVGKISYGLYLWHNPAIAIDARKLAWFHLGPEYLIPVRLAATLLAATLSYYMIERQFLRSKMRLS